VSPTVSSTFAIDARTYVARRSWTRSSAYAVSRFVNAQSPSSASRPIAASCRPQSRSASCAATGSAASATTVVTAATVTSVVRASRARSAGSSSVNHSRISDSPSPPRRTMEPRMMNVRTVSATPRSAGLSSRVYSGSVTSASRPETSAGDW
jgi:hypothetical protein